MGEWFRIVDIWRPWILKTIPTPLRQKPSKVQLQGVPHLLRLDEKACKIQLWGKVPSSRNHVKQASRTIRRNLYPYIQCICICVLYYTIHTSIHPSVHPSVHISILSIHPSIHPGRQAGRQDRQTNGQAGRQTDKDRFGVYTYIPHYDGSFFAQLLL